MDWIRVTVSTTSEASELVSEQLIEAGSNGTQIRDRRDVIEYERSQPEGRWDILDESILENMPGDVRVTGYYAAEFRARDVLQDVTDRLRALSLRAPEIDFGALTLETDAVDDEDWAENWKAQFVPFRLGRRMVVRPSWCAAEAQPGDRIIELDPGMAFGTGTHETTALCACLIEEYVAEGDRVVDVGTGTGILAIAAALCGARDVLATDIDPVAVRVASDNIRINHLDSVVRTRRGDLLEAVDVVADVLVANIIAEVIVALAEPVRARIRPGGIFLCSGIARERCQEVVGALHRAGYTALDVREKGEWAAIACRR